MKLIVPDTCTIRLGHHNERKNFVFLKKFRNNNLTVRQGYFSLKYDKKKLIEANIFK